MDNKDLLIEISQCRLQEAFKTNPDFNISLKGTQSILEKFSGDKSIDGLNGQSKNTEQQQEQQPKLPQVRHNRR